MAHINGKGPEGKGPGTGRGLGKCMGNHSKEENKTLGKGQGKRYRSGGGTGRSKRLKASSEKIMPNLT